MFSLSGSSVVFVFIFHFKFPASVNKVHTPPLTHRSPNTQAMPAYTNDLYQFKKRKFQIYLSVSIYKNAYLLMCLKRVLCGLIMCEYISLHSAEFNAYKTKNCIYTQVLNIQSRAVHIFIHIQTQKGFN